MANWSTKQPHKKGMGKSKTAYGDNKRIKKGWAKCIRQFGKKLCFTAKTTKPE